MECDLILQEVHALKKQMAAEVSFDLHALCEKLRVSESQQSERLAKIQPVKLERNPFSKSE